VRSADPFSSWCASDTVHSRSVFAQRDRRVELAEDWVRAATEEGFAPVTVGAFQVVQALCSEYPSEYQG
jgi:hypothetical protein